VSVDESHAGGSLTVVAADWLVDLSRDPQAAAEAAVSVALPPALAGRDAARLAELSAVRVEVLDLIAVAGLTGDWADRLWDLLVWRVATDGDSALRDELAELARTDPLTGLLNRRGMAECLAREIARSRRSGLPVALGLLDLDRFKRLNDGQGHPAGDTALVEVARLLRERLRVTDVAGRWGGDEFAVVFTATPGPIAVEVVDRVRATLTHPSFRRAGVPAVTFSAGVAALSGSAADAERLLALADSALYDVKRRGGNAVGLGERGPVRAAAARSAS
jgi:diguanylate cyclase (GGDEF)-like protein